MVDTSERNDDFMKKIPDWHLQLHAGEGAAEGAATGETQNTEGAADLQDTTGETQQAETQNNAEEDFDSLIKGRYKDDFDSKVQGIINKRFRETKGMEAELTKSKQINSVLSAKYGIDPTDTDALLAAVQGDESYYEDAAMENGMTVDAYKQKLKGDRAIAELEAIQRNDRRQQLLNHFEGEAEKVRQKYGDDSFTFQDTYNSNEEFRSMINGGVPVEAAYKVINMERLSAQKEKAAAENAERKVTNSIIANGRRPAEGGMKGQPPVSQRVDIRNLTDEEMDALEERARRGEKISLR